MKDLKEFYQKYKLLIWPGGSVAASTAIAAFVIFPQFLSYLKTTDQIASIQQEIEVLNTKAGELRNIDEQEISRNTRVVLTVLPTDQEVPSAMNTLQDLVNKSGLKLNGTSYSNSSKAPGDTSFLLNISVSGSLSSVREFLINLQDAPRIFQVEAIGARFQPGAAALEVQIPLSVLYEAAPQVTMSLTNPVPRLTDEEQNLFSQLSKFILTEQQTVDTSRSVVPLGKANPFE